MPDRSSLTVRSRRLLARIGAHIAAGEWEVLLIGADGDRAPGFAYTVGLTANFSHPELLTIGLPPVVAHKVLNALGQRVQQGQRLPLATRLTDVLQDHVAMLVAIPPAVSLDYVRAAHAWYQNEPFEVWQLLWPDPQGRLPGDLGYDQAWAALQPVLGTLPAPPN